MLRFQKIDCRMWIFRLIYFVELIAAIPKRVTVELNFVDRFRLLGCDHLNYCKQFLEVLSNIVQEAVQIHRFFIIP